METTECDRYLLRATSAAFCFQLGVWGFWGYLGLTSKRSWNCFMYIELNIQFTYSGRINPS
jgi:hypothetical protein